MMKTFLFFFVILLTSVSNLSGQIDEYKEWPLDSIFQHVRGSIYDGMEQTPEIGNYAIQKAINQDDYRFAARFHELLSFWYYLNYDESQVDTMIYHRLKQIEYDTKIDNRVEAGLGYMRLGIDYLNTKELQKSLDAHLQSLEILESEEDKAALNECYASLSTLYNDLNEPANALKYADLSFPLLEEQKDYIVMVDLLLNGYTYAYVNLEDYPKALAAIDSAIDISLKNEFEQREYALVESYNTKGKLFLELDKLDAALMVFNQAWETGKEYLPEEESNAYRFGIGNTLFLKGAYQQALPHLRVGVERNAHASAFDAENYKVLSECLAKLGQFEEALKYRVEYTDQEMRIMEDKITNLKSENLAKYESVKKDAELLVQTKIISQKNKTQGLIIGVVGLLVLLLSTLFYYFKRNQKTSQLLLEKNGVIEKRNQQNELLLKEIHHRVKNNLQTVSSLLSLQSANIEDKHSYNAILESKNRVSSMALIHQKLYQGENLAAIEMRDYFETVGRAIIDSFGKKAEYVSLKVDMEEVELDVDTAIPIGLITNELITNSIKHAFPDNQQGQIQITLMADGNDQLTLKVKDNGQPSTAVPEKGTGNGFGTMLIRLLTTQLSGQLQHSTEEGTSTVIQFPRVEKSIA